MIQLPHDLIFLFSIATQHNIIAKMPNKCQEGTGMIFYRKGKEVKENIQENF